MLARFRQEGGLPPTIGSPGGSSARTAKGELEMTRTAVRGATAVLVCAMLLAADALAAKPKRSARFAGHTSATPVEGFKAPVKFTVAAD